MHMQVSSWEQVISENGLALAIALAIGILDPNILVVSCPS